MLEDEDDMIVVEEGEKRTIEPTLALNLAYKNLPELNTASSHQFQPKTCVNTICHKRNSDRSPNVLVGPGVENRVQLAAIDCRSVACVLEGRNAKSLEKVLQVRGLV